MEIKDALRILGLEISSPEQLLNLHFRKLVKRYHPDFNQDRLRWAHKMMTTLNNAYEISKKFYEEQRVKPEPQKEQTEPAAEGRAGNTFSETFTLGFDFILEGIYIYYQYGLENIFLRKEGSRRLRYRGSVQRIRTGINLINTIPESDLSGVEIKKKHVASSFGKAFFEYMSLDRAFKPRSTDREFKSYNHYRNGSLGLDTAIKQFFFKDTLADPRKNNPDLSLVYHEFFTVLSKFPESPWINETVLRIYLLEVFILLKDAF